ncbi:MAG: ArnT family glycosyltransferase, partial [Nitrospinota bacterium]
QPFLVSTAFGRASTLWLPLQFWITGAVLRVYQDLWLVPVLLNLAFSLATLALLYAIATMLFDHRHGLVTVCLVGAVPWYSWLSISGMAEIPLVFFTVVGLHFFFQWEARPDQWRLLLSATALLLATMVRPEGWFYALLFCALLGWKAVREGWAASRLALFSAMIIPFAFVVFWLTFNYVALGGFLRFIEESQQSYQWEMASYDSWPIRLLQFPFLLFVVSPTLALLLPAGLLGVWYASDRGVRLYATFVAGGLGLLMLAGLSGLGTNSTPQRYVVSVLVLAAPLIAHLIVPYLARPGWRRLVWMFFGLYVAGGLAFGFNFSQEFFDEARVGHFLRTLRATGALEKGHLIVTDWGLARLVGSTSSAEDHARFLVDRWALQVLGPSPEAIVDSDSLGKAFAAPLGPKPLDELFRGRRVQVIVIKSPGLMSHVPPSYRKTLQIGRYRLFVPLDSSVQVPDPPPPPLTHRLSAPLGHDLTLAGYSLDSFFTSRVVRFIIQGEDFSSTATDDLHLSVSLATTDAVAQTTRFYRIRDFLPHLPHSASAVEVPMDFRGDFELPPGHYRISLSITDHREPHVGPPAVVLGPIALIKSKRDVVKRAIAGTLTDYGSLLKVLLSL